MVTQEQRDRDREAAEELAVDMGFVEAAQFLRAEIGFGLRDAGFLAERLAREHPASPLAASYERYLWRKSQYKAYLSTAHAEDTSHG